MQYEQATGLMTSTVDTVESNEVMMVMKGLMTGTMAKLENVNNADCDSTDEDNTYHCTVDITQSVNSNSKTSQATFKVYQVNDEWVLGVQKLYFSPIFTLPRWGLLIKAKNQRVFWQLDEYIEYCGSFSK